MHHSDNLSWTYDYEGGPPVLLAAGHPYGISLLRLAKAPSKHRAGSLVVALRFDSLAGGRNKWPETKSKDRVETIFMDDGRLFGTSSTAVSISKGMDRLVVSGLYEDGLLLLNRSISGTE
jgi:hypothetical protein